MAYYLFSLPSDLLNTLVPRNLLGIPPTHSLDPVPDLVPKPTATGSKTCAICLNASFFDVDDQRVHFRSDWHRYNVKLRLTGADAIAEPEFASLVEGLEDSLSGSASSSDDESDSTPDAVRALLAKSGNVARSSSPSEVPRAPRTALTWFHSPPSTQIGIYNAIFPAKVSQTSYLPALKDLQHGGAYGRRWTMLMVAGGHFAGVVVQVCKPETEDPQEASSRGKKKTKRPMPEVEILRHKTFHRYTTRRKQGGSQSMNDNAKGPAKSAGAQLRRYGEQALRDDIRELLADWAEDVASSELIWLRASVSNKRIFYDYDDAVFRKDDERLRNFPFPTRRPTQAELTRCLNELTRIKVSHLTEEALHAQDEAYIASLPKPKTVPTSVSARAPSPKPVATPLSKEQELLQEKWRRLTEMATKGRLEPFKALWDREGDMLGGINTRVPERGVTILQLATLAGQEGIVGHLLEDLHADPTIMVDEGADTDVDAEDLGNVSGTSDVPRPVSVTSRRTAYDLAPTRAMRNVFRRCAAAHPDWWDWLGAGRIPSALSREMEEEREERRKGRRKGLREKLRERQTKQEEVAPPHIVANPVPKEKKQEIGDGPRRLGGTAGQQEGVAGLSAEMRAKVERERRARAAETRLKSLGGAR